MADFIHVNLLPIEYRVVKKDYSWLIDARAVVPVMALGASLVLFYVGGSFFEANLAIKRDAVAKVDAEIAQNAYVADKIKQLEKLRDEKNAKNNSLKSISISKKKWVRILEGINKSLPLNMWIDAIKQGEGSETEMELKGKTYVFPEIAQYMIELQKNQYFSKVSLNGIELQKDADHSAFSFTLKISLNPNVGIDPLVEGLEKESYL